MVYEERISLDNMFDENTAGLLDFLKVEQFDTVLRITAQDDELSLGYSIKEILYGFQVNDELYAFDLTLTIHCYDGYILTTMSFFENPISIKKIQSYSYKIFCNF